MTGQEDDPGRPWLARYPTDVPPSISYPRLSLGGILDEVAQHQGEAPALVFEGHAMRWSEVHDLAERLAGGLHLLGVGKGDRVVLLLPNVPHFVIAYYATLKLGAVVAATNPLSTERELDAQLREISARVIVTLDILYDKVETIWRPVGVRHIVVGSLLNFMPRWVRGADSAVRLAKRVDNGAVGQGTRRGASLHQAIHGAQQRLPALRRLWEMARPTHPVAYGSGVDRLSTLRQAPTHPYPRGEVGPGDLAVLLRTGGTTGSPKAVALTHANLLANAYQMRYWFPDLQEAKETILAIVPFFHAFGLTLALNAGLLLAARLVLIPRIVFSDIFRAIDEYQPSVLPGIPSLFAALSASEGTAEHDLRSIRVCVSGGAPLPREVKRRFEAMTGSHLYQGYGLTEASPATHCEPHDSSAPIGSIGLPLLDTDALVVDEAGQQLPAGAEGELIVRGPQIMQGYWNQPEETASVLKQGWLHTGDVARMDEQGYFSIVERKNDVIITGGEHVYPTEVEELLLQHPKVKDAGVAGVAHPLRGEVVTAFIVLNEGESVTKAEIVHWVRSRLAPFKGPRAVEFRTTLPKSPLGKVLRRKLAADEAARLRERQRQRSRRFSPHVAEEHEEHEEAAELPIEDLFSFADDSIDFMSAGSFPASDPPPPPSSIGLKRQEE